MVGPVVNEGLRMALAHKTYNSSGNLYSSMGAYPSRDQSFDMTFTRQEIWGWWKKYVFWIRVEGWKPRYVKWYE